MVHIYRTTQKVDYTAGTGFLLSRKLLLKRIDSEYGRHVRDNTALVRKNQTSQYRATVSQPFSVWRSP